MNETFDAAWLELREPVDHRSRSSEMLGPLREWWSLRAGSEVLDLACGTGSNLRYLAPHLPSAKRWTLLDHDAALLARVRAPNGSFTVRAKRQDLSGAALPEIGEAHLVTGSALLDLVSERWLVALVDACVATRGAALFALTYDGSVEWSKSDPELEGADALVADAVNAHQRRDKGFGPALGPAASTVVEQLFRARGYATWVRPSDWVLGAADRALVSALVTGWTTAATEERPDRAEQIHDWAARRARSVERGDFTLRVGHQDLLALPRGGGGT